MYKNYQFTKNVWLKKIYYNTWITLVKLAINEQLSYINSIKITLFSTDHGYDILNPTKVFYAIVLY